MTTLLHSQGVLETLVRALPRLPCRIRPGPLLAKRFTDPETGKRNPDVVSLDTYASMIIIPHEVRDQVSAAQLGRQLFNLPWMRLERRLIAWADRSREWQDKFAVARHPFSKGTQLAAWDVIETSKKDGLSEVLMHVPPSRFFPLDTYTYLSVSDTTEAEKGLMEYERGTRAVPDFSKQHEQLVTIKFGSCLVDPNFSEAAASERDRPVIDKYRLPLGSTQFHKLYTYYLLNQSGNRLQRKVVADWRKSHPQH